MEGFHVGGMKYMTIKTDDRSVYGKKVRYLATALLQTVAKFITGKGGRRMCQDTASHSRGSLP